jgi:hypothetical protein
VSDEALLGPFRRRVEALEAEARAGVPGVAEAAAALEDEICAAGWATPEGRGEAQALVGRVAAATRPPPSAGP